MRGNHYPQYTDQDCPSQKNHPPFGNYSIGKLKLLILLKAVKRMFMYLLWNTKWAMDNVFTWWQPMLNFGFIINPGKSVKDNTLKLHFLHLVMFVKLILAELTVVDLDPPLGYSFNSRIEFWSFLVMATLHDLTRCREKSRVQLCVCSEFLCMWWRNSPITSCSNYKPFTSVGCHLDFT